MHRVIIEILASIIGFFALVSLDHLFIAAGFFSIWAFLAIYLYEKLERPIVWGSLILAGVALGVTVGVGIGTYVFSVGLSLLFLFLVKKLIPDDHFLGRYIPYLLSFSLFYLFRLILGDLSNNGTFPLILWEDIHGFLVKACISTVLVIVIDRFYSQLRHNGNPPSRGVGIEVRRR